MYLISEKGKKAKILFYLSNGKIIFYVKKLNISEDIDYQQFLMGNKEEIVKLKTFASGLSQNEETQETIHQWCGGTMVNTCVKK